MSFVEHFLSSILCFIKSRFSRQSTVLAHNSNQDSKRREKEEGLLPSVRIALLPQLACEKKFEGISLARNEKVSVIQMRSSLVAYIHRQTSGMCNGRIGTY